MAAERVTEHEWEPELREEILACLDECKAAGEMGGKEKHTHRSARALVNAADGLYVHAINYASACWTSLGG